MTTLSSTGKMKAVLSIIGVTLTVISLSSIATSPEARAEPVDAGICINVADALGCIPSGPDCDAGSAFKMCLGGTANFYFRASILDPATTNTGPLTLIKGDGSTCSKAAVPVSPGSGFVTPAVIVPFPGSGWTCADGQVSINKVGVWILQGVFQPQTISFGVDFTVVPEAVIGAIALVGSSLAAIGGYYVLRQNKAIKVKA